jgi:hypothetical protein
MNKFICPVMIKFHIQYYCINRQATRKAERSSTLAAHKSLVN